MKKLLILLSLLVLAVFVVSCAPKESAEGEEGALAGEVVKMKQKELEVASDIIKCTELQNKCGFVTTIKGYEKVSVVENGCTAEAKCPSGKFTLGGGCEFTGPGNDLALLSSGPTTGIIGKEGLNNWACHYTNNPSIGSCKKNTGLKVTATVFCASYD